MPDITCIILTYNEAKHIRRAIESAKQVCRSVIVVDSFSTDETCYIAKSLGATVLQNPWVNHSVQFNWALDNAKIGTEWVFRLDADEYFVDSCPATIMEAIDHSTDQHGYTLNRRYHFLGKWVKHGGMYPVRTLRLFKLGSGRVENRWMDEHVILSEGTVGHINSDIVDDNLNTLAWWTDKHNSYATKEMLEVVCGSHPLLKGCRQDSKITSSTQAKLKRLVKEKLYNKAPLFVRPTLYFLYRYFLLGGFLDGAKGTGFHVLQGFWYRFLVDLKVLEARARLRKGNPTTSHEAITILEEHTGLNLSSSFGRAS